MNKIKTFTVVGLRSVLFPCLLSLLGAGCQVSNRPQAAQAQTNQVPATVQADTNQVAATTEIPATNQIPVLQIKADQITGKVSPILYGLMTEEINYSYE